MARLHGLTLLAGVLLSLLFGDVAAGTAPTAQPTLLWFAKGAPENNNTINLAIGVVAAGGAVTLFLIIYCIKKGQRDAAAKAANRS